MHLTSTLAAFGLVSVVSAFPGLMFPRAAEKYNSNYKYTGASGGLPGSQTGGFVVPDPKDTIHAFKAPGPKDLRGPCPGLNVLANHGFLSRDGLTSWSELVDAQQNAYNMEYDLAVFLATIGVAATGDIATGLMSLGPDQTSRTSLLGLGLTGPEPGLNGHNKFESDCSLTRNDYWPSGDAWSFNVTMWQQVVATCNGTFEFNCLAKQRSLRYQESLRNNQQFYYGQKQLLMYGATVFIYKFFGGDKNYVDLDTMSAFFGAQKDSAGNWKAVPERFPPNFKSRTKAYSLLEASTEGLAMYLAYPVAFGGTTGPGAFNGLNVGAWQNGILKPGFSANDFLCLLYTLATEDSPNVVGELLQLTGQVLKFVTGKLNPVFGKYGCQLL